MLSIRARSMAEVSDEFCENKFMKKYLQMIVIINGWQGLTIRTGL